MGYRYTAALLAGSQGSTASPARTKSKPRAGSRPTTAKQAPADNAQLSSETQAMSKPKRTRKRPESENAAGTTDGKRKRVKAITTQSGTESSPAPVPEPEKKVEAALARSDEIQRTDAAATAIASKSKLLPKRRRTEGAATSTKKIPETTTLTPGTSKTPDASTTTATVRPTGQPNGGTNVKTDKAATQDAAKTKMFKKPRRPTKFHLLESQYKLVYGLRGHADVDYAYHTQGYEKDESINIWACDFEPKRHSGDHASLTNDIAALCGGNSILFLDVQQGRYVKKYTHFEAKEEFLCLAWTLLCGPEDLLDDHVDDDASCNILAAAGRLGTIKLLNPRQNQCFRVLFGHGKQIRKLEFSKSNPKWLFSASDDMTVLLWDIGTPNSKENNSLCLAKFPVPYSSDVPSALAISPDTSQVVIGCTNGDLLQYNITASDKSTLEKKAASKRSEDSSAEGPFKTFKHKMVYPAGDEWHAGYIDDVYVLGHSKGSEKNKALDGCIVSRGTEDLETIIWRPDTSTKTDADIAISLDWPEAGDATGLRFKVVEQEGRKVLLAGDYDGQIRIHDIGDGRTSRTLEDNSKEVFPPTKILSHPSSSALIRDICVSQDTRYIVAVDSANTVFVWTA